MNFDKWVEKITYQSLTIILSEENNSKWSDEYLLSNIKHKV